MTPGEETPLSPDGGRGPAAEFEILLSRLRTRELRDLATRHGVDVSHLRGKREIVGALSTSAAADAIADETRLTLEALEGGALLPVASGADLDEADPDLRADVPRSVDLARATNLRDQARVYFERGNFDQAIRAAEEAGGLVGATATAFQRAMRAFAILASRRILEGCERVGQPSEDGEILLREALHAFRADGARSRPEIVHRLGSLCRTLHQQEAERIRGEVGRVQTLVTHVANTGASVLRPEMTLKRAREAVRGHDPFRGARLVAEAERLATGILGSRIQEIESAIPETARMITEARHVGASVEEAEDLLEKARSAASGGEYASAAEFVVRAERAAIESQRRQIEIAMDLRKRQLDKAQEVLRSVEPLVAEAEEYDLNATEARTLLRQAFDVLAKEDYVNGMNFARNAAEVARRLEPSVIEERARRGIRVPTEGVCRSCGSRNVAFQGDGWSSCQTCGHRARWRGPARLLDRFARVLGR